jgi:hypothetical protein
MLAAMSCHASASNFVFTCGGVDWFVVVPGRTACSYAGVNTIRGGIMKQRMAARERTPKAHRAVAELDRRGAESGIDGALYEFIKS